MSHRMAWLSPGRYLVEVSEDGFWLERIEPDDDLTSHSAVPVPDLDAAFDELRRRTDADMAAALAESDDEERENRCR